MVVERQAAGDGLTLVIDGGADFLAQVAHGGQPGAAQNHEKKHQKPLGDSVAVNGVCLTIAEWRGDAMVFHLSRETLNRTTAGDWQKNQSVNLESSLRMGDELGGHFVFGHVDGVGEVAGLEKSATPGAATWQLTIRLPSTMAAMMAEKGSVAIDGCSLTVNEVAGGVRGDTIAITLIPHTINHTIAEFYKLGQKVNIEIDMLMRYVMRAMIAKQE